MKLSQSIKSQVQQNALSHFRNLKTEDKVNLYLYDEVLTIGQKLQAGSLEINIERETAFVFADLAPMCNWAHPCEYHLYNSNTGEVYQTVPASLPPSLLTLDREATAAFHLPVKMIDTRARRAALGQRIAPITNAPTNAPISAPGERYAILFAGKAENRHTNDLEFLYRTLIDDYGFNAANIQVLNHDGTVNYFLGPSTSTTIGASLGNWPGDNTPYRMVVNQPGTRAGFQAALNAIVNQIGPDDFLFIHTNNHGGGPCDPGVNDYCMFVYDANGTNWTPYYVNDFITDLGVLPNFKRLMVMMEQCRSGGFINPIINNSPATWTHVATAVTADDYSLAGSDFDPFAEDWIAGMHGSNSDGTGLSQAVDTNNDRRISATEAFDYADATHTYNGGVSRTCPTPGVATCQTCGGTGGHSLRLGDTPTFSDSPSGYGAYIFLGLPAHMGISFIVERSTLGEDEINARRVAGSAIVPDAFRVVVDGFNAADIGLTGPDSTLPNLPWLTGGGGIMIKPQGNTSSNGDYGPEEQRFTFHYDLDFGSNNDAFDFPNDTKLITLDVEFATFSASAQLELIKQPNPFILHGDPSYLSIDLRTFVVRASEDKFGVSGVSDATDAPRFIQEVMQKITPAQFETLPTDQEASALYLQPTDGSGKTVFNFALAKVHYIGTIGADNVRVFFRLLSTQSTNTGYDIPAGTINPTTGSYRFWSDGIPGGRKIALAGIGTGDNSNEYVTIPCFALPRVDTATTSMTMQEDSRTDDADNVFGNVQKIIPNSDGSEVDTFFGCWLDTNQPFKPNGDPNNVLPINVATNVDGPFTDADAPKSIQEVIIRNGHQCLIAEIAFDPVEIPVGKDPSNWDKLAQRNIAWSPIGSAQAVSTFEIRPTPARAIESGQMPDELMIDWGNTPRGSLANIYLPAVNVADVLAMADQMYTTHRLEQVDNHTLQCPTGGITYVPIPAGTGTDYAGLLSVDLPERLDPGQVFNIAVRQVTNAFGHRPPEPPRVAMTAATSIVLPDMAWRTVLGAFQLTIPVKTKAELLESEARQLSVLRWIQAAIPPDNRWYAVFNQYVGKIANRVDAFGGDSSQVEASPTGDWQKVRLCRTLAFICAVSLAVFLVDLGIMTNWVAVAVIAVFLAAIAFTWVIQCQPKVCSKLRVVFVGAGIGALILAILVLLGASSPQLVPVLYGAVALTVIAGVVGTLRKCF